ncbi:restriction endonuclease subunit S [Synechocystis sp. FACHB-383]|uniref:restriction endonuclease subunit S n=1 Tax=Synechocystis sp. FACHB-383 TaxID=2692864 RepID=UPI001688AC32|nr:restriction endonuclease subunit S [Synechocystis sp. FACHB-383]MBD2655504.1 restriction endonuclease subunit S [Synechocystis sp. FACHB-383]
MKLKPYPEYKDSGVPWLGKIPAHWPEKRAKYYFKEVDERSETGDEEMLSVSHITGVTPRSQKNVTMFKAESNTGDKCCQPGDLVINTMWAWMSALGVSNHAGIVSPAYGVYRPINSQDYENYYLDHLLRIGAYRSEYICRSTGIRSSRLRLYPDKFLSMPVVCPPQSEQQLIAQFLKAQDYLFRKFIRNKRRLIELLKEQKENIINQAVTRGLDPNVKLKPSGVDWIGDIPDHWEVRRVGNFARVGNGSTPSRSMPGYWLNGHFPWLNSSQVNRGFIDSADQFVSSLALRECHLPLLNKGTLLDIEATINQHLAFIDIRNPIVSVEYLQKIFSASYNVLRSISDASGSTKGALTCDDIKKFKVPLPPINEQDQILLHTRITTNAIDQTITRAEREIELMREYRTRLISDVVTGQVDVRDIEVPEVVKEDLLDLEEDSSEAMDDELEAGEEE